MTVFANGKVAGFQSSNHSSMCPEADLSCVFQPTTACNVNNVNPGKEKYENIDIKSIFEF